MCRHSMPGWLPASGSPRWSSTTARQTGASWPSLLESAGVRVITAAGGLEAIELARAHRPEVVFMDLKMNDLDGLEATRRLAQDPATATIPVIAVTASAFGDIRQTARDAGCVDYLSKPIRAQSLFAMLQTHLGVRFVSGSGDAGPARCPASRTSIVASKSATRLRNAVALGDVSEIQELARHLMRGRRRRSRRRRANQPAGDRASISTALTNWPIRWQRNRRSRVAFHTASGAGQKT